MANTPKATDGETPKRTRKAASVPEDSTKVTKSVKKVAAKTKEVTAAVAAPAIQEAKPAVKEIKSEVFVMQSLEEKVRARAYELYLRRGGKGGSPEQDWFQAMQEVYGESVA
jgi:cbb3-type cytochrome oxidase cytochrome c subunit